MVLYILSLEFLKNLDILYNMIRKYSGGEDIYFIGNHFYTGRDSWYYGAQTEA